MTTNYDPDGIPEIPLEMVALAKENGFHVALMICDEANAQVGDHSGVSFAIMLPFLPRKGDRIFLEDGRTCEVTKAYFKVFRVEGYPAMIPNVYAILLPGQEPTEI